MNDLTNLIKNITNIKILSIMMQFFKSSNESDNINTLMICTTNSNRAFKLALDYFVKNNAKGVPQCYANSKCNKINLIKVKSV